MTQKRNPLNYFLHTRYDGPRKNTELGLDQDDTGPFQRWGGWVRPYSVDILEALGFEDSTYIHDACPSWTLGEQGREELEIQIFIDFPAECSDVTTDPSEWQQYCVYKGSDAIEGNPAALTTNDFGEVLRYLNFKPRPSGGHPRNSQIIGEFIFDIS